MLKEFDHLPDGLLECRAQELLPFLQGPALIHLPGARPEPLFVSVLLHGNEDTGWEALRDLLRDYAEKPLPRALSIFIGNVEAAAAGRRRLDGQLDYNRVWNGGDSPEAHMVARVIETMREREVFAAIDIHNNTGLNPHYACINRREREFFHLARLFSRTVVYFTQPEGVASLAMSRICPSVTVECGKVGQGRGTEHARELVEAALHLDHFPEHEVPAHDIDLFHTVATVKVPEAVDFGFGEPNAQLHFPEDLDRFNFRELPSGTLLAEVNDTGVGLDAWNGEGRNVANDYFELRDGGLYTRAAVMPSMLTLNKTVIRQDCLCYLMERLPYPA